MKRLNRPPELLSPMGLSNCVTQRTAVIFDVLGTNSMMKAYNFMAKDPTEWLLGTLQGSVNNAGRERQSRESHRIDAAV